MDLRLLEYFVAVYEENGFTRAAGRLQMAQPPLSQAIARLERTIDSQLFERSNRTIAPTAAAKALYPEALFLLSRAREVSNVASGRLRDLRTVRIGCVTSALTGLMPQIIPLFAGFRPLLYDMSGAEQESALRAGNIDLAIFRSWEREDSDFAQLINEPLYVVVPTSHALAHLDEADLSRFADDDFISFRREIAPVAFDVITSACHYAGFSPRIVSTVRSEQAMFGIVASALGVTVVTEMNTRISYPGLSFIKVADGKVLSPLGAQVAPGDPLELLPLVKDIFRRLELIPGRTG